MILNRLENILPVPEEIQMLKNIYKKTKKASGRYEK